MIIEYDDHDQKKIKKIIEYDYVLNMHGEGRESFEKHGGRKRIFQAITF